MPDLCIDPVLVWGYEGLVCRCCPGVGYDRLVCRRCPGVGYGGLVCRHCPGVGYDAPWIP